MIGLDAMGKGAKEGIDRGKNSCCDCLEGCVVREKVYCSLDECFHPLHDKQLCESFLPKPSC